MQNINEIRQHIHAVEQTRKITSAMHLVSSARMKKAMPMVEYNRVYFDHVQLAMRRILASNEEFEHPYLQRRGDRLNTYIVIAGDKGLAGSYNMDVLKMALSYLHGEENYHLIVVGIEAGVFFRKQGMLPDVEIIGASQDPSLYNARHMKNDIVNLYDAGMTDCVFVVYTQFINSAVHVPVVRQLLPVPIDSDVIKLREEHKTAMLYHPSPEEMFNLLVPQYLVGMLYGALLHSYASEHSARMNAMQSATRNADELLKKLHSSYNMARQSAITQEIIEITGAAQAQLSTEETIEYA